MRQRLACPLFIYEGILIRRILSLLLSDVKGTLVLRLWWLASWGAMMLCAFIWLRRAISVDRKYFFQPLILFPCLILLYLHGYLYFRYYLDLYFFAVVLVTLTAVPFLRDRRD